MDLPETFKIQMKKLLGSEYEAYERSFEEPRVCGLRVNTLKISVEEFLRITPFSLEPVSWAPDGFYYDPSQEVAKHPHYYAGLYYIQEPSAMIPASRLPVQPGERVLDLCAAPGGKATKLGEKLAGEGLLVANDVSNSRAKGLLKNLERFGIGNVLVTSETPDRLAEAFPEFFDKILIDAPCSGEGMFRRDHGMIKSWSQQGPEYYSNLQREILQEAVKMLKPGGMMLYSTCTFSRLENEDNVRYLLQTRPGMQAIPMDTAPGLTEDDILHSIRLFPHRAKGEGHFAALVQLQGRKESRPSMAAANQSERAGEALPGALADFLKGLKDFCWEPGRIRVIQGRAYLLPEGAESLKRLRFLRTGLYLGEIKKDRFEPSQALAMHLRLKQAPSFLSFPSDDPRVVRYLKGETLELTDKEAASCKGWVLFGTDGYPLGWGKLVNGMLRNKYYPGWRMQ